jgi:hypothetical protein
MPERAAARAVGEESAEVVVAAVGRRAERGESRKRLTVGSAWHQKSERSERPDEANGETERLEGCGEAPPAYGRGATQAA